ncbi:hypothetical protein MKX03_011157 [Papaver bracteatum]|nr:hypothetical protein MKX03_011157 [Papaver bracteatum]
MEAYPMNGGNGPNSYANNSFLQRFFVDWSKSMIDEAIANYLDIQICPSSNTFRIADLGCSAGPNTFIAMQNIIEAIDCKYRESEGLSGSTPEFHVYFNDHVSNDFNTLFVTLPPEKPLLRRRCTLHVVHSSLSIQWLSQVPKEVLDVGSPAYNRGRIHYTNARKEVFEAYSAQYAKDIEAFLHARAEEVVCGGLLVLIVPAVPDESPSSQLRTQSMFDILGSCFMDMAKTGIVEEAEVDSFNLPAYSTTSRELKNLVETNGCFNIERIVDILPQENKMRPSAQTLSDHFRAALEGINLDTSGVDGTLDQFNFSVFPNLASLNLNLNNLVGDIPTQIGSLPKLTYLNLGTNLTMLERMNFYGNQLSGMLPREIGNMESLIYFDEFGPRSLKNASFSYNNFTGKLPPNICIGGNLVYLAANKNNLDGPIPESFRNCTKLSRVRLEDNLLEGDITDAFGVYPVLEFIDLSRNQLLGELSPNWGACTQLSYFRISENMISGEIPPAIASLKSLEDISLSSNKLSEKIPIKVGKLARLQNLDLSVNNLSGPIPGEIGDCQDIISLKLNDNKLNGPIPHQVGNLGALQSNLDLSQNELNGEISPQLGNLRNLENLNLSNNKLSGCIPSSLEGMLSLTSIDLSNNELEGPVPDVNTFEKDPVEALGGNQGLCSNELKTLSPCSGTPSSNNRSKRKLIIAVVVPAAVPLVLLILFGILCCRRNHKVDFDEKNLDSDGDRLLSVWFKDIVKATENFDENVYKATLQNDRILAVKRFHNTSSSSSSVCIFRGYPLQDGCMFLVYEYVERGSLANVLYNDIEAKMLDWSMRIKNYQRSKVSDFGTARLIKPDASNWTVPFRSCCIGSLIRKTPGEFLLRLLSEGRDLFLADALDKRLTLPTGVIADELVLIVTLALACTRICPNSRPTMHFVSRELTANTVLPIDENFQLLTLQKLLKVL